MVGLVYSFAAQFDWPNCHVNIFYLLKGGFQGKQALGGNHTLLIILCGSHDDGSFILRTCTYSSFEGTGKRILIRHYSVGTLAGQAVLFDVSILKRLQTGTTLVPIFILRFSVCFVVSKYPTF